MSCISWSGDTGQKAPSRIITSFEGKTIPTCYVGLQNLNNTCYLNSTIQALLQVPQFFEWATDSTSHKCTNLLRCVSCSLKKTVNEMCSSSAPIRPVSLLALLRIEWPGFEICVQQDAHEFLLRLLEQVRLDFCRETKLSSEEVELHKFPLGSVFGGWLQFLSVCKCTRRTESYELINHLNLPLSGSIQEALKVFLRTEKVDDFKCPACECVNSYSRKINIFHEPEILILQLKRFHSVTDLKCDDCVTIDMDIAINNLSYSFVSCVAHLGPSRKNGHYICITRCADGSFVKFDDHNVYKMSSAPLSLMSRNGYLIFYKKNPELPESMKSPLVKKPPLATSTPHITPLEVTKRRSEGLKDNSLQSPNVNEIQPKSTKKKLFGDGPSAPVLIQGGFQGSKRTVPPIKFLIRRREELKETSRQSSNIYDIKREAVNDQVPKDQSYPLAPVSQSLVKGIPAKITPIKISKRKREEPKENSQQSSNIYDIIPKKLVNDHDHVPEDQATPLSPVSQGLAKGIPAKITPIKINKRKREEPKENSQQSSNIYEIQSRPPKRTKDNCLHDEDIFGLEPEVSHAIGRSFQDVVLLPHDVPGAILPFAEVKKNKAADLKRYLECYGWSKGGNKKQLELRVENLMRVKGNKAVVPQVDGGKWYTQKRNTHQTLVASQPVASQPVTSIPSDLEWDTFPSLPIPNMFNYGHIYYYLIESMPVYSDPSLTVIEDSDSGFSDEEPKTIVDPFADGVKGKEHSKKIRRGMSFLKSGHVRKVENATKEGVYCVRAQVKASMRMHFYDVEVVISIMSGNIKLCTCTCKVPALGRCNHVSATLLFMWCHVQLNGYDAGIKLIIVLRLQYVHELLQFTAVTCTSKPCEWNKGSLRRNPECIREKQYPAYKIDVKRRQLHDPRPTLYQKKEATHEDINCFLSALSNNEEKTRWEYLMELKYSDFDSDPKDNRRLAMLCRKFLKNLPELIVTENAPTTENKLISYTYKSLPENTVFEIPGTQSQGASQTWSGRRSVLVTASVAHRAFHLTEAGLSGFLHDNLWSIDQTITAAMKYGTDNESTAREAYMKWRLEKIDPRCLIDGSLGLHVNSSYPGLGCSPDGIVHSFTLPPVLLEIKCLAVLRKIRPQDFQEHLNEKQLKRFCLTTDANGKFSLKETHKFYCQIQMSLGILKLKVADLALWSPKDILVVAVPFNENFFDSMVEKITKLHREVIVPEYFAMRVPRKLNAMRLIY